MRHLNKTYYNVFTNDEALKGHAILNKGPLHYEYKGPQQTGMPDKKAQLAMYYLPLPMTDSSDTNT